MGVFFLCCAGEKSQERENGKSRINHYEARVIKQNFITLLFLTQNHKYAKTRLSRL
jgi:hypothetical protein